MNSNPNRKPIIILAAVVLGVIIAGFAILKINSQTGFRLVSAKPNKVLPTSTDTLSFDFSRTLLPLDQQPDDFITLQPEYKFVPNIRDKTLQIVIEGKQEQNTKFVVTFKDLKAESGETLSQVLNYSVKFVPFNELSKDERNRQVSNVGSPQDRHPLLSQLPYDALSFRVEYTYDEAKFGTATDWKAEKDNFQVNIATYAYKDGTVEAYIEKHRVLRDDAKNWIRSLGVDPDNDIRINFTPTDEELASGQGGDLPQPEEFTGDGEAPADTYDNDNFDSSPYPAD